MTKKNIKYFNYAKNVAELSDFKKSQIGSVAVYGNRILSVGFNTHRTHPVQQAYNRYRDLGGNSISHKLHSEIATLLQIKHLDIDWHKVDLYIYRICRGKDREFGLSKPCASCLQMIRDLGIKNIYYTTDDSYCYEYIV